MAEAEDIRIERLGARGDGVAQTANGPLFVPFALPGETWRVPCAAHGRAEAADATLVQPAPDRRAPECVHFGTCGGCVAQHIPDGRYLAWKRAIVAEALRQQGLDDGVVAACRESGPGTRRRAVFTALATKAGTVFGFYRRAAHEIIDIEMCPVLVPEIVQRLSGLRTLCGLLLAPSQSLKLTVVAVGEGLDVVAEGVDAPEDPGVLARIANQADGLGVARLTVGETDVFQRAQPTLQSVAAPIPIPAGVFLQASAVAESQMVAEVQRGTGGAKSVADLFCGIGTFALAVARDVPVAAYDSEADALAALEAAVRQAQGLKPVQVQRRDLFREPLSRTELNAFEVVILDPPRAGARAQSEMLARSDVGKIIAVSCNPGTFARDARILVDGGYVLKSVQPIDQFVYSEHVELVAALERPAKKARARGGRAMGLQRLKANG